jgi:glutathione S-transferase
MIRRIVASPRRTFSTLQGAKLYRGEGDPSSRKVRIAMAEKGGVDSFGVNVVMVDLVKMENRTEKFKLKTGTQQVPILELAEGDIITESVAIMRYIDALAAEPSLFGGSSAIQQAKVEMSLRKLEGGLNAALFSTFQHTSDFFAPRITQVPEWGQHNLALIPTKLNELELELSDGRAYMAGDDFSVVDISAVVSLDFARVLKCKPSSENHPNITAWQERMKERPSFSA